jgi:hypothetical protein
VKTEIDSVRREGFVFARVFIADERARARFRHIRLVLIIAKIEHECSPANAALRVWSSNASVTLSFMSVPIDWLGPLAGVLMPMWIGAEAVSTQTCF